MTRSQARSQVFAVLFQLPFQKGFKGDFPLDWKTMQDAYFQHFADIVPEIDEKSEKFISGELSDIEQHLEEIDATIKPALKGWTLSRLAPADLAVLRLATYEILYKQNEIGLEVSVNEAVELAKTYSHDEGYAFVNGALRSIIHNLSSETKES